MSRRPVNNDKIRPLKVFGMATLIGIRLHQIDPYLHTKMPSFMSTRQTVDLVLKGGTWICASFLYSNEMKTRCTELFSDILKLSRVTLFPSVKCSDVRSPATDGVTGENLGSRYLWCLCCGSDGECTRWDTEAILM